MMVVAMLEALAMPLEPLAPMLQPLALPLPPPAPVMVPTKLHPPTLPLPALATALQPLASALELPAMPPGMVLAEAFLPWLPGAGHGERVGRAGLCHEARCPREQGRRNEAEQPSHPDHRSLPRPWPRRVVR